MDENPRITDLRKKLEKDPGSRLFGQLAEELRKEGKHDEAIVVARRGLEKNPNYPSARLTLARALLDSGRPREARPELEQVVKASPDNLLAGRLLADVLEQVGEVAAAVQQLERTLVFSPGDKPMTEKLALLRTALSAVRAAQALQVEAVAVPPVASAPAPAALPAVSLPEVAVPEVISSVALDRDLASGTFSPGSLMAADLQRHFEIQAAEAPAADSPMDQTLGFGEMEGAAFGMDTAETMSLEPAHPPAATPRTQLFAPVSVPEPSPPAAPESEPEPPLLPAEMSSPEPLPDQALPEEMSPEAPDLGAQTLPLTSVTLADLYLQQGLKAEASAVLSQVIMDEPDNAQARVKLAAVSDELTPPVLAPEEPPVELAALPVSEPPVVVAPVDRSAPAGELKTPAGPRALTRAEIRKRTILSLKAFKDAAEREAVHQRASEFSIR